MQNANTTDLSKLDHPELSSEKFDEQLLKLQRKLSRLQIGLFRQKKRAVVVLEGSDAAGKGGAIHRMISAMDPRGYRVYPIGPPTPAEAERHYLQRFWRRIPKEGQLAIFDRSWYGRVLVERVDRLAGKHEWKRAYREINDFERMLVDDGILLVKLLLFITREEQRERLLNRLETPRKQWKLHHSDILAYQQHDEYSAAMQEMLGETSTVHAPWQIVPANNKKYSRIQVLEAVVNKLSQTVDVHKLHYLDAAFEAEARAVLNK